MLGLIIGLLRKSITNLIIKLIITQLDSQLHNGLVKKKSAEADRRWNDARDKAIKSQDAKKVYKQAKATDKAERKAAQNTPEAKAARKAKMKKAAKVGAAVAGTALAAYGAYKLHDFVREKNKDIRVNEGKAKCDRMLKKLDRMRTNDRFRSSVATENWVKSGKQRTPFQYNNNGKTVTIPRQYRNTQTTLKPIQYRNIESKVIDKTISDAFDKAKNDSFSTATKNVYNYYRNRKR